MEGQVSQCDALENVGEMDGGHNLTDDLSGLGVSAKRQEDVEDDVIQLIKNKERNQRINQLKNGIVANLSKRSKIAGQLALCEKELQALYENSSGGAKQRRINTLLNDQEKMRSDLKHLDDECRSAVVELESCDFDFDTDVKLKLLVGRFLPKHGEQEQAAAIFDTEETEQEKSIRLGEVTAFGTALETTSEQTSNAELQAYLRQQDRDLNTKESPLRDENKALKRSRDEESEASRYR
jgi:hypothetical protein